MYSMISGYTWNSAWNNPKESLLTFMILSDINLASSDFEFWYLGKMTFPNSTFGYVRDYEIKLIVISYR